MVMLLHNLLSANARQLIIAQLDLQALQVLKERLELLELEANQEFLERMLQIGKMHLSRVAL